VRIIAGSRKGHTIQAPKGLDTRPTSDRAREAAFNLIGPVDGASVLDLFAGSGALGLEALSRGAASAVFVESDREACRAVERNLDRLRLRGTVICADALRSLAAEAAARRKYDLVLVDPPYGSFDSMQTALATYLPAVLARDGLAVVETESRVEPDLPPLRRRTSRRYGAPRISLFEQPAEQA
jgi:16S rRNA (guanine966-N2)-methyltransferase